MKALIVDDEPPVIAVARLLVEWEKHGIDTVLTCTDPQKALEMIAAERPAVILSDIRMPGLDGLTLIERVASISPKSRTILLSAYSDFSYARRAVQLGCVDYLLKPLTEEGLNDAVAKAATQYRQLCVQSPLSAYVQAQNLFSLYLNSNRSAQSFADLQAAAPFLTQSVCFGIVCTWYLPVQSVDLNRLSNKIHAELFARHTGVAALLGARGDIAVLLAQKPELEKSCEEYLAAFADQNGLCLHMGLSDAVQKPEQWETALLQARDRAASFDLRQSSPQVHAHSRSVSPLPFYELLDPQLDAAVQNGSPARVKAAAEQFAKLLQDCSDLTLRHLDNLRSFYSTFRMRAARQADRRQDCPPHLLPPFNLCVSGTNGHFCAEIFAQEVEKDLLLLAQMYPHDESASVDLMRQIRQYIEQHYESTISLDALAHKFSLSPSYLSRSFKRAYGEGVVDFITRARIEKSIELLCVSDLKQNEIAQRVGFSDPKYFYRVFKRATGSSPAMYRLKKGGPQ